MVKIWKMWKKKVDSYCKLYRVLCKCQKLDPDVAVKVYVTLNII